MDTFPPEPPARTIGGYTHSYLAWLYVLIREDHKAIKIGYAGDLPHRLKAMNRLRERQGKAPAVLLYAVGMTGAEAFAAETEIKALLEDRRNGDGVEWFYFSGHVLETIKTVIRRYDPNYKAHLYSEYVKLPKRPPSSDEPPAYLVEMLDYIEGRRKRPPTPPFA